MSSYALCSRLTERTWEVFCCRCRESIGTMDGDTLQRAIVATVGRGGVLCPKCRQASCSACGSMLAADCENVLCWFCEQEREEAKKVTTGEVPLV